MKVILLQDVKSLGKKGAMVEVNEGYARNFIIPKKLGMDIDKKKIVMKDSIKALGSFSVKVKLHPEVQAELAVKVEEA